MNHDPSLPEIQKQWHGSFAAYLIGFILSLLLTFLAYYLVAEKLLTTHFFIFPLLVIGTTQAIIQLLFFLHIGKESQPRWRMLVFVWMITVLLIIVLGTIWIMFNLDSRVMPGMYSHD